MADYKLDKTTVATSDPISICDGKALFPPFPDIGAGVTKFDASWAVVDHHYNLLAAKAKAGVHFGFFMGLCGPGYGLKMDVSGEVKGDELHLKIENDHIRGGFVLGMTARIPVTLEAKVWKFGWDTLIDINAELKFDLIRLILDVLQKLLEEKAWTAFLAKTRSVDPNLLSSYGMLGQEKKEWVKSNGVPTIEPHFNFPVNLWPLLVASSQSLDEFGVGEIIEAIDDLLRATMSAIRFGPEFGVGVPIKYRLSQATIDGVHFNNNEGHLDHGTWIGRADHGLSGAPQKIDLLIEHSAGFDFTLGVFAGVKVLEFFHVGASFDLGILSWLHIVPYGGWFSQGLSSDVGQTAGFQDQPGVYDVEFA